MNTIPPLTLTSHGRKLRFVWDGLGDDPKHARDLETVIRAFFKSRDAEFVVSQLVAGNDSYMASIRRDLLHSTFLGKIPADARLVVELDD